MPKKHVSQDRKAGIAEMQEQEKARENRERLKIIAGCGAVLLVLGTTADRPKMERLVHNLEHGYTVLWYHQQAGEAKKAELEQLAKVTNKIDAASEKFIVSAWDTAYGELPAGKKFALSHWSATPGTEQTSEANQVGNRQLCGDLSGWSSRPSSKNIPAPRPRSPTANSVRPSGGGQPHQRVCRDATTLHAGGLPAVGSSCSMETQASTRAPWLLQAAPGHVQATLTNFFDVHW